MRPATRERSDQYHGLGLHDSGAVLGRQRYETAVEGKNWRVCIVERGWMGKFDWPEFWNPKVRAADCLADIVATYTPPTSGRDDDWIFLLEGAAAGYPLPGVPQ